MILLQPPFPFVPAQYRVKTAVEPWERADCAKLRRSVFCDEQQLFEGDDRDAQDEVALAIAAVACVAGMAEQVVGTVRICELEAGLWQGSRLAVHRDFRAVAWIGSELIRHAVGTARARGCVRFLAHVQAQNVPLFRRLHWTSLGEELLHGRSHHLMQVDLTQYAPRPLAEVPFVVSLRNAA
jgi:putative N-acetyltransferase (TIGR04045 family)